MVTYNTKIDLTVEPVWHQDPPEIIVRIGSDWSWTGFLKTPTTFSHAWESGKDHATVSVEFLNKRDADTLGDKDKATVIRSVRFNGIGSDKLLWQGKYYPRYPEPWATEQKILGQDLPEYLSAHTYLGWNGIWILEFGVPVFTWIHQIEDLGWIYD